MWDSAGPESCLWVFTRRPREVTPGSKATWWWRQWWEHPGLLGPPEAGLLASRKARGKIPGVVGPWSIQCAVMVATGTEVTKEGPGQSGPHRSWSCLSMPRWPHLAPCLVFSRGAGSMLPPARPASVVTAESMRSHPPSLQQTASVSCSLLRSSACHPGTRLLGPPQASLSHRHSGSVLETAAALGDAGSWLSSQKLCAR